MPQATIIDLTPKERGVEGGAVEDPLRYALCVEELVICDNRHKSAVKYFLFFRSPVVVVPHLLPTAICLLSFSLEWLIAVFAFNFCAGWKIKIQDLTPMTT